MSKVKVTLSIDSHLLKTIDMLIEKNKEKEQFFEQLPTNRSQVVNSAYRDLIWLLWLMGNDDMKQAHYERLMARYGDVIKLREKSYQEDIQNQRAYK